MRKLKPGEQEVIPLSPGVYRVRIEGGLEAVEIPFSLAQQWLRNSTTPEAQELLWIAILDQNKNSFMQTEDDGFFWNVIHTSLALILQLPETTTWDDFQR